MRLFDLARLRPEAWGMTWCPGAARHLQALKDLGALDLKSGDWMASLPISKYEAGFDRYFAQARKIPLEKEAALLQLLTQQTCLTDFAYAGYLDSDGHPVLRRNSAALTEFWGWGSSPESAVLLLRRPAGSAGFDKMAEPLPCTPLFIFNGDRRGLLNDTARNLSFPTDQMAGILPPFFSGIYE
jgi:hypothetical protein